MPLVKAPPLSLARQGKHVSRSAAARRAVLRATFSFKLAFHALGRAGRTRRTPSTSTWTCSWCATTSTRRCPRTWPSPRAGSGEEPRSYCSTEGLHAPPPVLCFEASIGSSSLGTMRALMQSAWLRSAPGLLADKLDLSLPGNISTGPPWKPPTPLHASVSAASQRLADCHAAGLFAQKGASFVCVLRVRCTQPPVRKHAHISYDFVGLVHRSDGRTTRRGSREPP